MIMIVELLLLSLKGASPLTVNGSHLFEETFLVELVVNVLDCVAVVDLKLGQVLRNLTKQRYR